MLEHPRLAERVIGVATEVHGTAGPGLLESVYTACMCRDLERAGIEFQSEAVIPVTYKGETIPLGFRAGIVVANSVILEIKAAAAILPAHEAQILTCLRMSQYSIGLILNFHAPRLTGGLRRFIV
jgi:GxxExxY protein